MNERESIGSAVAEHASSISSIPVDQRLLATLRERGPQTVEQLTAALPEVSWTQVFLAIDRLSRSGSLFLWRAGRSDYRVTIGRTGA